MAKIFEFNATNTTPSAGALTNVIGNPWSVVRDSIATYISDSDGLLKNVAAHFARIQDSKVLVEGAMTQMLRTTEDVYNANSDWVLGNGATETVNFAESPSGDIDATKIIMPSTDQGIRGVVNSVGDGVTITTSAWVKRVSGTDPIIVRSNGWGVSTIGTWNLTSELQRLELTWQSTAAFSSTDSFFIIYVGSSSSGTNEVVVSKPQVEIGSSATSYLPTTGSYGSRAADVITNTVPSGTGTLTLTKVVNGVESSETVTAGQALTMENGTQSIIITDSSTTKKRNNGLMMILKRRGRI